MFRTTLFLPLAALACLGQAAAAPLTFSRAFNLYDDYTQYLYSSVNTEVHSERVAGNATFWRATPVNTWGEVVYRFPVSFRIQSATLEAEIAAFSGGGGQPNFDPLAEAHLDVSTDGIDWTTVASRTPGNGGYWRGPADITELVAGANTVYVRARLFSTRNWPVDGAIFAQFMRTGRTAPVADGGRPSLDFQAVGVPEPDTMILAAIGLLGILGARVGRNRVS